jgi:DNA-directed RNA polymerase beta' subunit
MEMNLHLAQDAESDSELRNLAAVPYQMISPANNASIIGIFQDSLLGCYRFTRENIRFTPREAMNLLMMFQRVNNTALFGNKDGIITSFDILSQIIPPLTMMYKTDNEDTKTSNNVLEIRDGKYIRGQMEKGVLGAGSKGLIHRICNDYGNMASADFIDDLQNIVTEYLKISAFSVGISDLKADDKTNQAIIKIIAEKKNDVKNLIDQTQIGVFENNTGKTNEEEFETKVNNILNQASAEAGKIGLKSLDKDNRFVVMVNAGSKGSDLNISQMVSCLGQQNVDGRRIPYGFDNRTLPHFTKFDDSPGARGFVESSYINGLNPQELFFHAMAGRVGLIDTAVKSVTWETPIIIIENSQAKYTEIGKWIDAQLDDVQNKENVQHFTERQMELLNINNGDVYIPTTDENGQVTWGEVTAITRHDPGTQLYEIKTSGGRNVIVTESKSLLIWNPETKKLKEMLSPDIKVGDCVPVTAALCEPPIITDHIMIDNIKFDLNEENGIFVGHLLSSSKNINDTVTNYLKEKINYDSSTRTKLRVPVESFIAPECFIIGLLNAYFFTFGRVRGDHIVLFADSLKLIEDISMLCSRLGIFGIVKNYPNDCELLIHSQWCKLFIEKVLGDFETRAALYRHALKSHINGKVYADYFILNEQQIISHDIAQMIISNINTKETYNDVVLDKIVEINVIGIENHPKMYDLTIPTTLNFGLANGLQVRDTSTTGYIQRRLIKGLEDLMVGYDMALRTNKGKIVQFTYGDDGIDPVKVENQPIPLVAMSIQDIYAHFNIPDESGKNKMLSTIFVSNTMTRLKRQAQAFQVRAKFYTDMMIVNRDSIIKNVFKNKGDSVVNVPVAFAHIINNIQGQQNITVNSISDITPLEAFEMIEFTYGNLEKIRCAPPTELFKTLYYFNLSPKELLYNKRFNKAALTILLDTIVLNYKRAIVAPGEMVGMIAAQSIGEPTTQMCCRFTERIRCAKINKKTKNISMVTEEIGELCDGFIDQLPEFTFNTGHVNSVETLLDTLEDEYYIVGVDEQEQTHWNKISHVSRHPPNGAMMKVTTKSGRIVDTTTSHSHLIRKDQKVSPIIGADMTVGMRIPVAKHIDNTFVNDTINIGTKTYKLDYLFGWFIGAYLAEGHLLKKTGTNIAQGTISITNISQHFIENTKRFAQMFGKECRINERPGEYGPGITTIFSHKLLADTLIETCGTGSFVKRVPDFAFLAPNEFKAGLIQAYLDGGGNFQNDAGHHQIRVCSRSKQLIKDVSILFSYFDIVGSIKEQFVGGSTMYNLAISPKYAPLYKQHINSLIHSDKLDELVAYDSRENVYSLSDDIDRINGLGEVIATCGKLLKLPGQSRNYGRWAKKESIGRRTLEKYISIFESHEDVKKIENELCILKQAANSSVIWDEIVNIEIYTPDQTEYVYDFTVPGNQTFMTDYGVIVHNTLNTFHHTGISSKSNVTRGVPRIEEILSLSSEPKNPSLTVFLKPEEETDREKAQSIMYMLEHTKLQEIVQSIEMCFDPDNLNTLISEDVNTMEQYRLFEQMIDECAEMSLTDDNEKSKWIIRMVMDPTVMLEKNITMDDINFTLKNGYQNEISCVYSDYNADKLVFRIRMNNVISKGKVSGKNLKVNPLDQSDQIYILKNFQDQLLNNVIIRGVKNIKKVILRKIKDNVVESAGSYKKQDIWVLDTIGTNILDVLALDYIDSSRTYSNDIIEIYEIFGIEAARQTIYNELVDVVEFDGTYINFHHLSVLCDRMTFTNKLISIFRHGINNDNIGPIAKASFEETPEMFLKAARHAELDMMRGVSANVMCGQEGLYGTNAFQVVLDIDEMRKLEGIVAYENPDENAIIEKMFGGIDNPDNKCSTNQLTIQNNVSNIKSTDLGADNNYNPGF